MFVIPEIGSVVAHAPHAQAIAQAAVPIVPILLFPFFLVLFLVVAPIWMLVTGLLSIVIALLSGMALVVHKFAPGAMEQTPVGGINLAVFYGLGLIAAAFGLALVYELLCRRAGPADGRPGR